MALLGLRHPGVRQMRVDIFPAINAPQIYVVNNFAGMDPSQIEGIITNVYEQNFQYVDGLKGIESKNIQNMAMLKLTFIPAPTCRRPCRRWSAWRTVPRTDAAQRLASVRDAFRRGQRPHWLPGAGEQDPAAGPIGGPGDVSHPPDADRQHSGHISFSPFGSNTLAIVITVDPDRLRAHNFSPEDVVAALETGNVVVPSGNLYTQGEMPLVPTNAMVADPQEMGNIPIQPGKDVYIRDVATIWDTTDINYGCALVNGRKSIFIPVVKKDTASTLTVVREIHQIDAVVQVGTARGRERPLRVRRIADGAGGHQERRHRGSGRRPS